MKLLTVMENPSFPYDKNSKNEYNRMIYLQMETIPIFCYNCNSDVGNGYQLNYYNLEKRLYVADCVECGSRITFNKHILRALGFLPYTQRQIKLIKKLL